MHGTMCVGVQVNKRGTSALEISTIDPDKFVIGFSLETTFYVLLFWGSKLGVIYYTKMNYKWDLQPNNNNHKRSKQNTKMPRFEILDQQQEEK